MTMATDPARRKFLDISASLIAAATFPRLAAASAPSGASRRSRAQAALPDLLGSWERDGAYYAGLWRAQHGAQGVALPFRAHGVLADPRHPGLAIVVARRPGAYVMRFDAARSRDVVIEEADSGSVFNGHAALSADGSTLYTTENALEDGSGLVGVRDPATLVKRGKFATHGMDPHELLVEPQGTLLVANGGILTLPETGRTKLNTDRMDPSLVRLDARDGQLLGQWRLPDSRLSIRHLARAPGGTVGVALQAEHAQLALRQDAPLFAWFDGASLRAAEAPANVELAGYGGDVACVTGRTGTYFAVSCTRAGLVACWDSEGRWLRATPLAGACALAPFGDALIAAGEEGELARVTTQGAESFVDWKSAIKWDNHMAALTPWLPG
jgi:uncharacterized protein